MASSLKKLRRDLRSVRADEIARRYLVLNAFDGVLATLGIVAGAYFAGATNIRVILVAALGASTAMGISGAWGAYLTERAERTRAIRELETELFTSLRGSMIEDASKTAVLLIALVDVLAPLLTSLICLSPIMISFFGLVPLGTAVVVSITFVLLILFMLGMFIARTSNTNLVLQGVLMALAGFVVFFFVYLLGAG